MPKGYAVPFEPCSEIRQIVADEPIYELFDAFAARAFSDDIRPLTDC